jgi:hypothetical protein
MLITENKFRSVVRQTLKENHYRIDEHFYNDLNRNLMNEGLMDSIKSGTEKLKNMFKSKDKKIVKKAAFGSNKILIGLALVSLFNGISHGQVMKTNYMDNLANIAQALEDSAKLAGQSGVNLDDAIDIYDSAKDLADLLLKGEIGPNDPSIKETLKLIAQVSQDGKLESFVNSIDTQKLDENSEEAINLAKDIATWLNDFSGKSLSDIQSDADLERAGI